MSSTNWIIIGALVVLLVIGAWYYSGGGNDTAMDEPVADPVATEEPAAMDEPATDAVDGAAEPAN